MIKIFNNLDIEKKFIKEQFVLKLVITTKEVTMEVLRTFNKLIFGEKFIKEFIKEGSTLNIIGIRI